MKDNYSSTVTAPDEEEDAQAAEYEEDDRKIKDVEDARDDADSNYHDSQESQSSGHVSQDSHSSVQDARDSHSSGRVSQSSGQETQESQSSSQESQETQSSQDSEESQLTCHELEDSQSSFTSFSSDISYPPFKPKTRKVMNLEDEDEEEAQSKPVDPPGSESTPGKKQNRQEATPNAAPAASTSSGSITPTGSNAGEERVPLFLPSSPSPELPSPIARVKEEMEESEELLFLPSSQESTASSGDQEKVEAREADAPLARPQPAAERTLNRAIVLQTLDVNRIIDNATTQDTAGKDHDKNASPDGKCDDGYATPVARTPTQSTFGLQVQGRAGDRTPTGRSPDSVVQGKKGNGKRNGSSEGKSSGTSPVAKPRSNKRPAEDSPSPRRSSKAENRVPGVEERKHKMMRKV